ncbi:MAG: transposase [Nitrosomonas sp.]|nr:transposase [Nitrosomonas sp.]
MLDGVYRIQNDMLEFRSVRSPKADQLQRLLNQIIQRIMKALTRHGALIEEEGMTFLADMDTDAALAPLQSAVCTYRIALGPRAGQKVLTLKTVATQNLEQSGQEYCANAHSFSLHAGVRCAMNQRNKLERLCRYITRPVIADERLARNKEWQSLPPRRRGGGVNAENTLSGWHDPHRLVATGIYATAGCFSSPVKARPYSFSWCACAECRLIPTLLSQLSS